MAILHAGPPSGSAASPAELSPPRTPGLFVATVLPATAVSAALPVALLPPRALAHHLRGRGCSAPTGAGDAQLIVSTETALELLAVDGLTESLVSVERVPVFGRVRALARMRLNGAAGVDVLLVLVERSKISFVQWDERAGGLACVGSVFLFGMVTAGAMSPGVRKDARLLVVHPRRKIAAVATLESRVSVFPVMFLSDCVSAGKVASMSVDGVVLSMAFLEDEDGTDGGGGAAARSILIALVQQESRQFIAVFAVGAHQDAGGGGGLSIAMLASMSTCAARSEDIAVERIQSKLTGAKPKPPRAASSVAAVPGKPYLFVVCLDGRLVVADARAIVCDMAGPPPTGSRRTSLMRPSGSSRRSSGQSSRAGGDGEGRGPNVPSQQAAEAAGDIVMEDAVEEEAATASGDQHVGTHDGRSPEGGQDEGRMETEEWSASGPSGSVSGNPSAPSDLASASHFESAAAGSAGALSSCPDGTVSSAVDDDAEEPEALQTQVQGDEDQGAGPSYGGEEDAPMAVVVGQSNDEGVVESPQHDGDDAVIAFSSNNVGVRSAASCGDPEALSIQQQKPGDAMPSRSASLSGLETYVSYLYMPPHFVLDVGDSEEGYVGAISFAGSHFHSNAGDEEANSGSGLYVLMESGRIYALRWQSTMRSGRVPCFVIPRSGDMLADVTAGSRPSPFFSVELVGDIGSSCAVAALAGNLLYASNDGADGALRFVHLPARTSALFKLSIRQRFLNMAPISDFALLSLSSQPEGRRRRLGRPAVEDRQFVHTVDSGSGLLKKRKASSGKPSFDTQATPADDLLESDDDVDSEDVTAIEAQLIVCSGIGEFGTLRALRPGAAVSVFSTSGQAFPGCNGMWSLRASRRSEHHGFLVMTFAETTGVYCLVPSRVSNSRNKHEVSSQAIAQLWDGSEASKFLLGCRTIASGLLVDGVLAQVHRNGVRLVQLKKLINKQEARPTLSAGADGFIAESLAECTCDWDAPSGSFITAGCVHFGHIVIAVRDASGSAPRLCHLRKDDDLSQGLKAKIVSTVSLNVEVSSLAIPTWVDDYAGENLSTSNGPLDVVVVTTYAPAVELRSLSTSLRLVSSHAIETWPGNVINDMFGSSFGTTTQSSRVKVSELGAEAAAPIAESVCGLELGHRKMIVVGLRDGFVLTFIVSSRERRVLCESAQVSSPEIGPRSNLVHLHLLSRRRLGRKPVRVCTAALSNESAVLAECERPWAGTMTRHSINWTPLQFPETGAAAAACFAGAERCLAFVSADGALHIGAVKRLIPVTVSTVRVGATPRRVCSLACTERNYVAVATSSDDVALTNEKDSAHKPAQNVLRKSLARYDGLLEPMPLSHERRGLSAVSDVRVYDMNSRSLVCRSSLLEHELVHVLLSWRTFLVVGTSLDLRRSTDVNDGKCSRGRLLLISLTVESSSPQLEECCQVILPGAVLAGTVNSADDCIVISSNERIYVFTVTPSGTGLFELARVSTRMLVVSLAMRRGLVCAADRKDSVVFYRVDVAAQRLIRCRGDYRKRVVSDVVLVDNHTAIAVDRLGHLFSLAYDVRDQVRLPESGLHLSSTNVPAHLFGEIQAAETSRDFDVMTEDESTGEDGTVAEGRDVLIMEDMNASEDDDDLEAMDAAVAEAEGSAGGSDIGTGHGQDGNATEQAPEEEDGGSGESDGGDEADEAQLHSNNQGLLMFHGPQPIQRHLVCDHAYGLGDVAVRTRNGTFMRREQQRLGAMKPGHPKRRASFWQSSESCVLSSTLSGAIFAAIPVNLQETFLLHKVSMALALHPSILGSSLGVSHEQHRSAYGEKMQGTLDGDLLRQFCALSRSEQEAVASSAGFVEANSAQAIVELIHSLWDRVL